MSSQNEIEALNALVELNEAVQEQNYASMSQFFDKLFAVYSSKLTQELRPEDVESSYAGVHLNNVYEQTDFTRMIESFRNGQTLHAKYALQIIEDAIKIFQTYPNVLTCNLNTFNSNGVVVVGDLHGSFKDLYYIISKYGVPGFRYCFVFNGDFVDRGPQQAEVLLTLLYAFLMNPGKVFLNRGNHEDLSINLNPNFTPNFKKDTEIKFGKYGLAVFNQAQRLFRRLPLATIIENNVGLRYFVAHGGLSNRLNLDFIKSPQFNRFQFANVNINPRSSPSVIQMAEQLTDLLWSDPSQSSGCRSNHHRGIGYLFGSDVSQNFCARYRFNGIIRSHEVRNEGVSQDHPYCLTVFSSSRYCGGSNKAAVIILDQNSNQLKLRNFDVAPLSKDEHTENKILLVQGLKLYLRRNGNEILSKFQQADQFGNGHLNIDIWAKILSDHVYEKHRVRVDPRHFVTLKDNLCPCNEAAYTAQYKSMFKSLPSQNSNQIQLEFIRVLFSLIDSNGSGSISRTEAESAVGLINKTFGTSYSSSFITQMDTNNDGKVDINEFYTGFSKINQL